MLSVALPKGTIAKETLDIFEKIFQKEFVFEDRKLIFSRLKISDFYIVRNQDVPSYVLHQAAGITRSGGA